MDIFQLVSVQNKYNLAQGVKQPQRKGDYIGWLNWIKVIHWRRFLSDLENELVPQDMEMASWIQVSFKSQPS